MPITQYRDDLAILGELRAWNVPISATVGEAQATAAS
jgi:hypothetical protein